ncbi:hypothetical protein [Nakamurella sp.]|uniref:hypothetical protein n=1 Tax=Nakamurella sp. TaxID=1869182 RepID=UPI003B3A4ED3
MTASIVGDLAADVVGGARLHIRPDGARPASLRLPDGWECVSAEIHDPDGRIVARIGDRVEVTGAWIEGLVALRGPSRVLRVHTMRVMG